jgi:hypothetical protein
MLLERCGGGGVAQGAGEVNADFAWAVAAASPGALNGGQSTTAALQCVTGCHPPPPPSPR